MNRTKLFSAIQNLIRKSPHYTECVCCSARVLERWSIEELENGFRVWHYKGRTDWANYQADDDGRESTGWHCPRCYQARQLRETERDAPRKQPRREWV